MPKLASVTNSAPDETDQITTILRDGGDAPTLLRQLGERAHGLKRLAADYGAENGSDRWLDILAYELALTALMKRIER